MSHNEVCFNVYHGGYWVKDYKGEFAYLGGEEMIRIEFIPEEVFNRMSTELRVGLYGQKIWYKLPYDDHKDMSFQKMCEAGRWTGFVDVFLVNSTEHPHDVVVQEPCDAELRVERNVASFGDEDPDFDYHNTPPNSDDEKDGGEEYVRLKEVVVKCSLNKCLSLWKSSKRPWLIMHLRKDTTSS